MKFDTTEKIDFYLPKVKSFIDEVVVPVEQEILKRDIPEEKSDLQLAKRCDFIFYHE